MLTSTRLGRYVLWNRPTDKDHLRFPADPLLPALVPVVLPIAARPVTFRPVVLKGRRARGGGSASSPGKHRHNRASRADRRADRLRMVWGGLRP